MARDPAIRTPVLLLALGAVAVLAIGLPFGAVQWLHAQRLGAADAQLAALADALKASRRGESFPAAVGVLSGPGDTPRAVDARWVTGTTASLSGVSDGVGPDPWGNAYVLNVGSGRGGNAAVWALSAGPNGIIETPFQQPSSTASPAGDDIAVRIR